MARLSATIHGTVQDRIDDQDGAHVGSLSISRKAGVSASHAPRQPEPMRTGSL